MTSPTERHQAAGENLRGSQRPQYPDVTSDAPSITAARVRVAETVIAPLCADAWPLAALGTLPTSRPIALSFAPRRAGAILVPQRFKQTLKRVAYQLINERTPTGFLERSGSSAVAWPSPGSMKDMLRQARYFFAWLDGQGVEALADCTAGLLDTYRTHVLTGPQSVDRQTQRLALIPRLHAMGETLPEADRLCAPLRAGKRIRGTEAGAAGSRSAIIPPGVMDPLLTWALTFVRDLAPDILAARNTAQEWLPPTGAPATTKTSTGRSPYDKAVVFLESYLREHDGRLPGHLSQGQPAIASTYLAARYGLDLFALGNAAKKRFRSQFTLDLQAARPVGSEIRGTIHGRPWTGHINFDDVTRNGPSDLPFLLRMLQTAAFICVAYLSGMRPNEVLSLPADCLELVPPSEPGGMTSYLLNGRLRKGQRKGGEADIEGREAVWVTIKPGADAVRVAAELSPASDYLFPGTNGGALKPGIAVNRISAFVDYVNELVTRLDLPSNAYRIPADPNGALTPSRFRRSLAWHIQTQAGGEVALAVQYQHTGTSLGRDGYSCTADIGVLAMMDDVAAEAHTHMLDDLGQILDRGNVGVSGPAARRLVQIAKSNRRLQATFESQAEANGRRNDPDRQVYDNPNAYSLCVYNRTVSLCGADDAPDQGACKSACPCHARTDVQIERLSRDAARHRAEAGSPLIPEPLRLSLGRRADREEAIIAQHERTRWVARLEDEVTSSENT